MTKVDESTVIAEKLGLEEMNMIEKTISSFMKRQLEEQKRSKRKEKIQVCIKPNSYIGKEIQYQTVLLHEILEEIRKSRGSKKSHP